jgi:Fic family protein
MKKQKPKFNTKQRTILQLLNKSRTGLTIYDISKQTGVSWVTVKKYLKEFVEKGIIEEIK